MQQHSILLLMIHQFNECYFKSIIPLHLFYLQEKEVFITVVLEHIIINFGYNPENEGDSSK